MNERAQHDAKADQSSEGESNRREDDSTAIAGECIRREGGSLVVALVVPLVVEVALRVAAD